MVASACALASRKRKKMEEMAESPPKRVTRARAAKGAIETDTTGPRAKKITTASSKAAASNRDVQPENPMRAAKRKTKANADQASSSQLQENQPVEVESAPAKTRSTKKRYGISAKATETPKPHARQARSTKQAEKPELASKTAATTRSRRGIGTSYNSELMELAMDNSEPVIAGKRSRGRPAGPNSAVVAASGRAAGKKKVTFEDEVAEEKENIPITVAKISKARSTPAGLKAKPIRKAVTRTGRGGKAITLTANSEGQPLSPKKITQVAKCGSGGSEDELCQKSPVKSPMRSPTKALLLSPTKRPGQLFGGFCEPRTQNDAPPSPCKSPSEKMLTSPAKRPQPSPFKDALKQSPIKFNVSVPSSRNNPDFSESQSPFKDSLKQSPRKGNISVLQTPSSAFSGIKSPLKASLLGSPARRPPMSSISGGSPHKLLPQLGIFDPFLDQPKPLSADGPTITPARLVTCQDLVPDDTPAAQGKGNCLGSPVRTTDCVGDTIVIQKERELVKPYSKHAEVYVTKTEPAVGGMSLSTPTPLFRSKDHDSDSEDELQSAAKGAFAGRKAYIPASPTHATPRLISLKTPRNILASRNSFKDESSDVAMTPLAVQMNTWFASSPEKADEQIQDLEDVQMNSEDENAITLPKKRESSGFANPTFFEDQMVICETEQIQIQEDSEANASPQSSLIGTDSVGQNLQVSEQEGDENTGLNSSAEPVAPAGNIASVTPSKAIFRRAGEVHTVSKVPLRPEGYTSTIKIPKRRRKSISGPLAEIDHSLLDTGETSFSVHVDTKDDGAETSKVDLVTETLSSTPTAIKALPLAQGLQLPLSIPRSARHDCGAKILCGAVIHVDVHTTEGEDSSGLFIELLTQMGAKCVKQWTWNPTSARDETLSAKVGITHVVFKDGSKRTLQKVREAKGLVLCVGVGWVLDCERQNKWLDEASYSVDTSMIPRGGHNRRKSMEPKRLSSFNGTLLPSTTPAKSTANAQISPTREFLNLNAQAARDSLIVPPATPTNNKVYDPRTPNAEIYVDDSASAWGASPTTPYFMSKGAQLVQMTCPPKQTMQGLFPVSGNIDDQPDEGVRQRLLVARRKSLQWAPKIASPLARSVSYEK